MSECDAYLTFNGNCREAFDFYRTVFGGDFDYFSTFDSLPEEFDSTPEDANRVMHVSLKIKNGVLMGCDNSSTATPVVIGNNFSISVTTTNVEETDEYMAKMSKNGMVTMPAEKTFWGAYFGMCRDQFGINWMFSCAAEGQS